METLTVDTLDPYIAKPLEAVVSNMWAKQDFVFHENSTFIEQYNIYIFLKQSLTHKSFLKVFNINIPCR